MNISINKKNFSDAIHIATKFSEKKNTTLPVLSSILIVVSDGEIKIRATNLEIGVDLKIEGDVKENGVVAIPSSILQQIANSFISDGNINIEHTGDVVLITSGTGRSLIKTVSYDDFPSIPFPESSKNRIIVSGIIVRSLFSSITQCASQSTIRPELSSVYLSIEGGVLTAAATDSFRLVEKKIPLINKGIQGKFLIPAKNAMDIAQVLPDDDVIISFDEHQCVFVTTRGMFVSRLTNAVYPDYRQIIPKESVAEAVVLKKDFEVALKQTTIFSDTFQKIKIGFDSKKNVLSFFARNSEIGESSETISANISGNSLDLSFNHRYLTTITSLFPTESISLTASGIGRPVIVKGVGDTSLMYLVSPMNQ